MYDAPHLKTGAGTMPVQLRGGTQCYLCTRRVRNTGLVIRTHEGELRSLCHKHATPWGRRLVRETEARKRIPRPTRRRPA